MFFRPALSRVFKRHWQKLDQKTDKGGEAWLVRYYLCPWQFLSSTDPARMATWIDHEYDLLLAAASAMAGRYCTCDFK